MSKFKDILTKSVTNRAGVVQQLYEKSVQVVRESQYAGGGTGPSFKGSRYAGNVYPRDHAYATMALTSAGLEKDAKQALIFMLTADRSEKGEMFQRYNQEQQNSSNKPPQIDGNALTLVALGDYVRKTGDRELIERYEDHIRSVIDGLQTHIHRFPQGDLIFCVNGNIEFSPYEEGFEIYTNACTCKAFREAGEFLNDSSLSEQADRLKKGIEEYLYIEEYGGFMPLVRREPNPSVVIVANLTTFQAMTDFEILPLDDERIRKSMKFHLDGTRNEVMGGFDRYAASIGRHNFGNGPWPREMMRMVWYYVRAGHQDEAIGALDWCLNVALQNLDVPLGLPEHVVPNEELEKEFHGFMRTFDINPREERKKEYEKNIESRMYKETGMCYPVNPLVWSHAMFVIVWNDVKDRLKI